MTTALAPQSLAEAEHFAKQIAQSALLPDTLRGKPGDVLVVLLTGLELGLSAMQSLRGIYVVKGRPILAADTLVALCVRSPVCERFVCIESTPERAIYETQRKGSPPVRRTWTMQDAKRANLGGSTWSSYPAQMLRHRCAADLARDVYPDLVLGLYEEGEAAEIAAPKVEVVPPAPERRTEPTVEAPKALPPPSAEAIRERIAQAKDMAALETLVPDVQRLSPADREAVKPAYKARVEALRPTPKAPATEVQP